MWYQVLLPAPVLMVPILIMTTKGTHHNTSDNGNAHSDVIVTYSNHAEANHDDIIPVTETNTDTTATVLVINTQYTTMKTNRVIKESSEVEESPQEEVLFIPNEKEVIRNEDYLQHDGLNIQDLMGGHKTVGELLAAKDVRVETESPHPDVLFITGKNNENVEKPEDKPKNTRYENYPFKTADISTRPPKLKCKNLVCNNTINSICGEKIENHQLKYRLFLNDCYFRKVNCNFRISINRYKQVSLEMCKNYRTHRNHTPFSFKPPMKLDVKPVQVNNTRRNFSSRRSMSMGMNGQFCSHACPVFCPEHYEPECAVSNTGRHRVFVNHCALDHNSCSFGVTWRSVPLAECVGGKKADMKQNAGFIGWMQQVGIVDKRGRLVLNP